MEVAGIGAREAQAAEDQAAEDDTAASVSSGATGRRPARLPLGPIGRDPQRTAAARQLVHLQGEVLEAQEEVSGGSDRAEARELSHRGWMAAVM